MRSSTARKPSHGTKTSEFDDMFLASNNTAICPGVTMLGIDHAQTEGAFRNDSFPKRLSMLVTINIEQHSSAVI